MLCNLLWQHPWLASTASSQASFLLKSSLNKAASPFSALNGPSTETKKPAFIQTTIHIFFCTSIFILCEFHYLSKGSSVNIGQSTQSTEMKQFVQIMSPLLNQRNLLLSLMTLFFILTSFCCKMSKFWSICDCFIFTCGLKIQTKSMYTLFVTFFCCSWVLIYFWPLQGSSLPILFVSHVKILL